MPPADLIATVDTGKNRAEKYHKCITGSEMVKKDYNGLLVQVCNPSAMAEAIEKLITDTELRKEFGRHSVERQHSMFSLTAYINNFDRLYTKTMGEIQ